MSKREFTPEEIAKSLRMCHGESADKYCPCPCGYKNCYTLESMAADMIEAQAKRIAELESQLILRQDELLRLREENRWIPAAEPDLPKEFVSVLVCVPSDDPLPTVKEAYLVDDMWVTKASCYTQQEVTHWKPMPKGPEAGDG